MTAIALLMLICSLSIEVFIARAGISANIDVTNFQTVRVNQPVDFNVSPFDGTPPYSFQWCTQAWSSIWGTPIGSVVEVSGATSSTFDFVSSAPGVYSVSVKIWDSAGAFSNIVGLPAGLWVTVKAENFANPIIDGTPNATVTIQSPLNKTYNQDKILFSYTILSDNVPFELYNGTLLDYWLRHGVALDYDTYKLANLIENTNLLDQFPNNPAVRLSKIGDGLYAGNTTLTNLSQGNHNITVWLRTEQDYISYGIRVGSVIDTVSFTIDIIPPEVLILSPQAKIYNANAIPLDFAVNKPFSNLSYSLDGQKNVALSTNMTLNDLSNGVHTVTVFATDLAGNVGPSETLTFTVAASEPFSWLPVAAVSVAVATVIIGAIVITRKRKRGANSP